MNSLLSRQCSLVATAFLTSPTLCAGEQPPFMEQDSRVVIEAEHFHDQYKGSASVHEWSPSTGIDGYLGDAVMWCGPNIARTLSVEDAEEQGPRLTYRIEFQHSGDYQLWLRGWSDSGKGNSAYGGIDGVITSGTISCSGDSQWEWNAEMINVPTVGVHEIGLWMREDGFYVDRIVLSQDASVVPSNDWPESPKSEPPIADSDEDGLSDQLEQFFGTDPTDGNSWASLTGFTNANFSLNTLEFPHAMSLTGLTAHVETSQDMTTWTPIATRLGDEPWTTFSESTVVDSGSFVTLTHPVDAGEPRHFYRLRVGGEESPRLTNIRALCVVADFANQRLEDYSGLYPTNAFTTTTQIRETLDTMEDHWAWMSVNSQLARWDLIRIELDQDLLPNAFAGWGEYRNAVAEKVKQAVEPADYDADGDGVIDTTFIVASSNDETFGYLIGGASRNNGINCFVDGQSSLSIRNRAIGNFNHEAGHNQGLIDIYGSHDNVTYLSLMSDSWPVPPFGFSAFDRHRLGWMASSLTTATTTGLTLKPAEENLESVRIPTEIATEYFLIEYRKKPESGFGSLLNGSYPAYDGLAIYHVDETKLGNGNNNVDPPLIMLEKPDGAPDFSTPPMTEDFWYPGNPSIGGPFYAKPYYDPALDVFRLENLQFTTDGMEFDVIMLSHDTKNLIENSDFSNGLTSWATESWSNSATFAHHSDGGPDGSPCVSIVIGESQLDDARYTQRVNGLEAGTNYALSGWIKGMDIVLPAGATVGANVSLLGGWISSGGTDSSGSFDWKPFSVTYTADNDWDDVAARLGFFASTVSGTAYFDKISLVELP